VVTPNSDTPYSSAWLDLRAEPIVLTMPKIDKTRYYTAQLIDLQTFNFALRIHRHYFKFDKATPGLCKNTPTTLVNK
jgi:hypothetical protein